MGTPPMTGGSRTPSSLVTRQSRKTRGVSVWIAMYESKVKPGDIVESPHGARAGPSNSV